MWHKSHITLEVFDSITQSLKDIDGDGQERVPFSGAGVGAPLLFFRSDTRFCSHAPLIIMVQNIKNQRYNAHTMHIKLASRTELLI